MVLAEGEETIVTKAFPDGHRIILHPRQPSAKETIDELWQDA
jgi:hypothetical protein